MDLYFEGMQAAYYGLLIKDCPHPRNSKRAGEWREGYSEAYGSDPRLRAGRGGNLLRGLRARYLLRAKQG